MITKVTINGITIKVEPQYSEGVLQGYRAFETEDGEWTFTALAFHPEYYGPTGFDKDRAIRDTAQQYYYWNCGETGNTRRKHI